MSGGRLNYFYGTLEEHIGDFGDRELDNLVKDLAELFHDREWYLSGDCGEGDWREARDEFKAKWFTKHGRQKRIEKYLDEIRREVLDIISESHRYCKDCKHWKLHDKSERYGDCELTSCRMVHRCEQCDSFERRTDGNSK